MAIRLEDDGMHDLHTHLGRWSLCAGAYEVDDRGDGIAEVVTVLARDSSGAPIQEKIVAFVRSWKDDTDSAFPGFVRVEVGTAGPELVNTVDELESFMVRHALLDAMASGFTQ